jgi:gluconokinase
MLLLVMGVSGSGKTTIGISLATRLDWPFVDADQFHSAANIAKMRGGAPLTDGDRKPWLASMAAWMDEQIAADRSAVTTASALKREYRDLLRRGRPDLRLIYLAIDRPLAQERLAAREGHFFPASLLDSQFRVLEPPEADERVLTVSAAGSPEQITTEIIERLELAEANGNRHR